MKKYKYPLDKVLMLREFEEYKERIILGKINEKIVAIKDELIKISKSIDEFYKTQELDFKKGLKAEKIQYYSYLLLGNWAKRRDLEKELKSFEREYDKQLRVLLEKRNRAKILKDMKERNYKEFKKDQINKESNEVEELSLRFQKLRY